MAPKRSHEPDSFVVLEVIDKKKHNGTVYYKLKWADSSELTWESANNCQCPALIEQYEASKRKRIKDIDDNEWEVDKILGKRTNKKNEVEYLLKWRNWTGEPDWVREDLCNCVNLIAAYENPKLRKMWNFQGNNPRLWLNREPILTQMKRYANKNDYSVNVIKFEPDMPDGEEFPTLRDGVNIGPLSYKNHWYLVIILINHICITRQVLIGDPLNTMFGCSDIRFHPVYKRLRKLFDKTYHIKSFSMTPMERSDLCAFYVLAAYERALFLLQDRARFIPNKIFFDTTRAEAIRSQLLPDTDGEISAALPVNSQYLGGPQCEFCDKTFETFQKVDDHIVRRHFKSKC